MARNPHEAMQRVDRLLSHVWMVRTFLKHSDEAAEDQELAEIHRSLYDFMLALGGPFQQHDAAEYLRVARKKLPKLRRTAETFQEIQPEVSAHMNFRMAVQSLLAAVHEIAAVLESSEDMATGSGTTADTP